MTLADIKSEHGGSLLLNSQSFDAGALGVPVGIKKWGVGTRATYTLWSFQRFLFTRFSATCGLGPHRCDMSFMALSPVELSSSQ